LLPWLGIGIKIYAAGIVLSASDIGPVPEHYGIGSPYSIAGLLPASAFFLFRYR
jgi:hypothetical protein